MPPEGLPPTDRLDPVEEFDHLLRDLHETGAGLTNFPVRLGHVGEEYKVFYGEGEVALRLAASVREDGGDV